MKGQTRASLSSWDSAYVTRNGTKGTPEVDSLRIFEISTARLASTSWVYLTEAVLPRCILISLIVPKVWKYCWRSWSVFSSLRPGGSPRIKSLFFGVVCVTFCLWLYWTCSEEGSGESRPCMALDARKRIKSYYWAEKTFFYWRHSDPAYVLFDIDSSF